MRSTRRRGTTARARSRRIGAVSQTRGQSACSSRGGPGSATATRSPSGSTTAGAVPDEPHPLRPVRKRRLLAHAGREVRVRPLEALGDGAGQLLDRRLELFLDMEPDAGRVGEQLDRAVVVRRPEPARDDEQVVLEPSPKSRLEIGRVVADDRDPRRFDTAAEKIRREVRPVAIGPVAANELRARRDDRGAYAACQPVFVTMPTRGCAPGTRTT